MTDKTPQTPPETLRDTIRSAMDTEKEKISADEKEIKAPEAEPKAPDKVEVEPKKEKTETDPKEVKEPKEPAQKDPEPKTEEVEAKGKETEPKEPKKDVKVPFGVPKNVREKFATLDADTQEYITKITKEIHDHRSNEGRKSYLKDVDQVLAPYQQQMQNINVTPAAVVKRLLEYSDALSSPQYQQAAIIQLAQDFKIDLVKVVDDLVAQGQNTGGTNDDKPFAQIPPEVVQKLDAIQTELSSFKAAKTTDNDKAAADTVNQWAGHDPATGEYSNKPYFPYVRKTMHSLIASGTVPLVNGRIDLDGAYDAACYAHPEIREMIVEDQLRTKESAIREQQQQQIAKAKSAGISMKPGAPVSRNPVQKKNNGPQPYVPARDSIRAALSELKGGRA